MKYEDVQTCSNKMLAVVRFFLLFLFIETKRDSAEVRPEKSVSGGVINGRI